MTSPLDGSTSAPALHPDLGPGAGQGRDAALDGEVARVTAVVDLPAVAEHPATEDVDAAIAQGRDDLAVLVRERQARATMTTVPSMPAVSACATCGGAGWIPRPAIDPQLGILGYDVCPGCGGTKESER